MTVDRELIMIYITAEKIKFLVCIPLQETNKNPTLLLYCIATFSVLLLSADLNRPCCIPTLLIL